MKFQTHSPGDQQSGGLLTKLLLALALLFVFAAVAWVLFLPRLVIAQIHSRTGFVVTVDQLSVNPFTAKVVIAGLVVKNPPGWPAENFVELRQFKAETSLPSLFTNKFVANEVVLDVARCTLVKNKEGVYNAKVFSDALSAGSPAAPQGQPQPQPKSAKREFLIKHLILKFDTLTYADYSGPKPTTKDYNLNLNRELQDVDSVAQIVNPISTASLGVLTDSLSGILNGRSDLLKDVTGAIKDAGKKTGEKLKGLLDALDKKKP